MARHSRPATRLAATALALLGLAAWTSTATSADLPATSPDRAQVEQLLRQTAQLTEDVAHLRAELARPRTREEAFAQCMQAARGATSAMAAESIGEHCDLLLKR